MAKARKSRHRYPVEQMMRPDAVSPEYQLEVDRSTAKLERDYAKAAKRLEAAERRAERAGPKPTQTKGQRDRKVAALWAIVEARRDELRAIERLMTGGTYAGLAHQGRGTHRPTTGTGTLI